MGKQHAYILCTETLKPKQLLCSIYSQLQGGCSGYKRKAEEGYAGLSVDNLDGLFKELGGEVMIHDVTSTRVGTVRAI